MISLSYTGSAFKKFWESAMQIGNPKRCFTLLVECTGSFRLGLYKSSVPAGI